MSVPSADSDTKPGKNPTLPRSTRRRRRVLWSFVWLLGLAGLLLAVSYTGPVQRWTFARVAARLESGSGIVLRADRTSFDPIRLRTSLDGVSIASRQTPSVPYFTATHVELDAPAAVLRGRLVFNRVRLVNASVDLAKVAHGGPDGGPFRGLGSLQLGDVSVENLSYASGTPGSSRVTIQHVSMKGAGRAPGRLQLESVSPGTLSLEIGDAQLAFGTLTASIVIDGDRLTITRIDARSDTAHVELNGAARFDSGYPIELDYRASIDLPRAADWWAIPDSTLRGQADLSGRISGPLTSPTATARTVVTDFAWRTLSAGRLTADGFITGPGIRIDTFTLAVPEVTARGNGFLSWSDDTPLSSLHATWQAGLLRRLGPLVELDAEDIPLVAATGTANVTWPGFVPDLAALAGTLQTRVASSHPDGDDRGTIDMAGGDARWRMDWRQWLPGDTTAHGQFTVRIDPVVFARSTMSGTLDVTAVDIAPMIKRAAFLDISVPESALTRLEHGRAALSGPVQGTVAMPQWHATLDATDVVMSGLRDITVDGHFVVDPDWFVTEDLTVRAPGSTILVSGTIGVLQPDSDISFNGTVDAAWASAPFAPAEWPLTGTATIKGTWITRTDADDLDVTFESSTATVAGTPVGPLQGRARSGLEEASGHLDLPELGVHLSGTYDLTPAQAHTVSAVVRNGDVSRWLTLAGAVPEQADAARVFVDGTVEASGTFESLETATITARIDALRGNLRGRAVHLSAPAQIVWTRGAVDLGAAVVAVGGVTFAVAPAPDGAAASVVTAAAPLSELLSLLPAESIPAGVVADGGVRVEVRIPHADPRNPTISAVADIHTVTRDGVSLVHDLRAEARADRDRLDVPVLRGTVLGATVDATATAATAWITPQLAGAPTDSSLPTTSTGARLTGTIRAELGPVLEALGVTVPDLSGTGHVTLDLTADASRLDAIRGTIVADTFTLQTRQGTFSQDGPLGVRIEQGSAIVESFVVKGPDSRIQVSGRAALSGETIDVLVEGTASMSIVDALVAPRVGGWADIELHVGGSVSAPALDGSVALRDVSAVSPTARLVLADLNGSATFRPGVVESVDVRGQLNGGTITLTGKFPLGHTQPDGSLVIVARDIFVEYPQGLKNRISADLALEGSAEAPRLTGTTTLLTDPYRESLPRMAQLLAAFGQPAAVAGGGSGDDTSGLLGRLSLDVAIVAAAPLRLDNSLGRIEALPRVRLVGTGLAPALSGPVEIFDGGRIYLQSRTYTLVDSRIDFFPEDGFVPRIQLHGTTKVGEYDVTLRISGPADALELNLSSDPPLPERDLQGLLLTGQTSDGAGGSGETGFAVTALSSDLLGMAGQALGLDSVRIGSESFELVSSDVELTTRLTVSKTLLNRFELIYSENLDNNTTTWILIYRPRRGLEVRASSRDNLTRVAEFRHQLTFGPGGAVAQDAPTAEDQPRAEVPREFVAAVDIIGVPPAAAARLRSILKMKTGRAFDYTEWMRDHDRIRRYYADSGYLTARVVPTRAIVEPGASSRPLVRLGYRVTPGPATSIVVTGMPVNRAFMTRLQQAWALTTFDQFAADDMSRTARGLLFDQGFVIPDVRTVIEDGGENTLVATVTLQPGPKPAKRAVVFDGMTVFSELELVALAVTSGTAESAWRDPGALCLTVANAYADAGYRKAVVRAEPVRVTGDSAELTIVIVEGRPTRVARVRIDGVPEARMTGAQAAAGLEADAILPAGAERAARLRLERYLRNLGFRNATVTAFVGAPGNDGRVDVSLSVSEGRLQVVRAIRVEGLQTTRPSLIDRAVTLTPGSPAGLDAEAETERRLYALGVFNSARVRLVPVPREATDTSPDIVPVNAIVSVTEPNKYQFTYGVEFANDYGPIFENFNNAVGVAADVRDRNVFGRGMSMSLGTRYETNLKSVRTLFGMPTIGHVPIRTNVFLAWRDQYTPIDESGELREMSRRAYVEQRWRPKAWIDLSWGYAISDRLFALPATRETPELSFEGILASLNAAVVLDRRDNAMNTSRGWFHSSSLQQGGTWLGSDLGYSRYLGRAFYFVPFGRVVSASGVRFGILTNMSGDAPLEALDLLFRAGGSQTVRGYGQDQLSISLGDGLVFGGTHLLVVNQEFRVKAGKWLQAVVFADAGRSFGDEGFRIRDLAVGLGFGVRIVTPLAPLRIDMGFPVPRRPGDPRYRWHVSVGHIF
jgi:outer membrane protein assembly factor BamA